MASSSGDGFAETARPLEPDQRLLASLLRRHQARLDAVHAVVTAHLPAMLHSRADAYRDLTFRHALPFLATLEACGDAGAGAERIAAGAVLSYSIPLHWIDSALDGAGDAPMLDAALIAPLLSAAGYRELSASPLGAGAVACTGDHVVAIVAAMRRDAAVRYDAGQLSVDSSTIESYWSAPDSRLNGSGIGALMISLGCLSALGEVPPEAAVAGQQLGRLRQLGDELRDVVEDAASGLVTLPVLFALHDGHDVEPLIRILWSSGAADDACEAIVTAVLASSGPAEMLARADAMLARGEQAAREAFPNPEPIIEQLRHRRLSIDRALANRLSDRGSAATVADLLQRSHERLA